jgi:hypothetical protein
MNLGDLITSLKSADPNQVVHHGFHNPHSYRGDYYDLAFEPATDITVAEMLEAAESAVGATYQGWKGGDFRMDQSTWCWLSEEGRASGETISPLLLQFMLAPIVETRITFARQTRTNESEPWQTVTDGQNVIDFAHRTDADASVAQARRSFPNQEHRLITRTATVTEEPVDDPSAQKA